MTDLVITFREPAKQLNLNHRSGWRANARLVKHWRFAAKLAAVDAVNRHRTQRDLPLSFVQLSLPVTRLGGRRDPSNWAPTTKACVDGLVDAGLFADDDSTHVITLEPNFHRAPSMLDRLVHIAVRPATGAWAPDVAGGLFT